MINKMVSGDLKLKLKVIMISNQLLDQQKQTKLVDLFLKCP